MGKFNQVATLKNKKINHEKARPGTGEHAVIDDGGIVHIQEHRLFQPFPVRAEAQEEIADPFLCRAKEAGNIKEREKSRRKRTGRWRLANGG